MIEVYGASDDLIEVEGEIREEFSYSGDDERGDVLGFSDGTLLSIEYGRAGIWRINLLASGALAYNKDEGYSDEGQREDGKPAYSDVVTLSGEPEVVVRWVVHGENWAKPESKPHAA